MLATLYCAAAALHLPSGPTTRRNAVSIAAAAALPLVLHPSSASAKILKATAAQRKEASERAREYKFSKPLYEVDSGSPEFLANARRRNDFESGTQLRDGKGATRDPITFQLHDASGALKKGGVAVEESGWDRPAPGARDGNDRAFPLPERARKLILARLPKFLDDEA